ncbi:LysR family transcriptional regulator [Sphingoaurantiacus capsulatus]|uniref:LysR family transcriptional regulator n=1 Tax=Sphingoaurantiacus capsulatus TaxID=1771310 RepID=A0ABV7X9T6_9SPHN
MLDWTDLRYFLAVARSGSTLAAGRALGVSQTTAARRVSALEESLELTLFERRQSGYVLTPAGETLLTSAQRVESAAGAFADLAAAQTREVSGTVKLTTEEMYAVTVLAPILRELREAYPAIRIELDTSDEVRDLGSGAADVALRSAKTLVGDGLVARRIAWDPWTVYCSRAYAEANGIPRNRHQLKQHVLIGGGGKDIWRYYRAWLQESDLEGAVVMQHSSPLGLLSSVRAGVGLAALPTFIADRDPDLIQCLPPKKGGEMGLYLVTHERLRHTPRVRAVMDFLAERLVR